MASSKNKNEYKTEMSLLPNGVLKQDGNLPLLNV